jgi:PIN domain nuclease of toxin-antitoxin system
LSLAALDFKSDPADELIAATSLTYRVPLLTRDARIRTSKLVPFA